MQTTDIAWADRTWNPPRRGFNTAAGGVTTNAVSPKGRVQEHTTALEHQRMTANDAGSEESSDREMMGYDRARRLALERDGYTCQDCGSLVGEMNGPLPTAHTHHTDGSSQDDEHHPGDLLTLCRDCHDGRHTYHVLEDAEDTSVQGHPLEENPNWKGGRTITSHGYVLIKRPDHPGSDTRGYIYEHRYVAEEMLGRPLTSEEQVHHKNGDKKDNHPENLEVVDITEHRARHRSVDSDLRDPGESNPEVDCACGCGETFLKYDDNGRPREYVSGHNLHPGGGS